MSREKAPPLLPAPAPTPWMLLETTFFCLEGLIGPSSGGPLHHARFGGGEVPAVSQGLDHNHPWEARDSWPQATLESGLP